MRSKAEVQAEIDQWREELDLFEIDPDAYEDSYREYLDEQGTVEIGTLKYDVSRVLQAVDPVAYRCGLLDYVDSIDKEDDPGYKEIAEEVENLEDELSEILEEVTA